MSKFLATLTVVLLIGLALLAPRQHFAAQAGTDGTPEPTATEPVMQIQDGLTLDSNYSDTENASPKLSIKLRQPVLVGKPTAVALAFNKATENIVKGIGDGFKEQYGQLETGVELPAEIAAQTSFVDETYEILEADPSLISIKFNVIWYGAGAAHPNTYSITLNYDLKGGRVLTLANLFKPGAKYLDLLADYATKTLTDAGKLDFPEGAQPKAENYQSWNITKDGLQINFDDYQVTPHAVGPQIVVVPYATLASIINPNGPLAPFSANN